MLVVHYIITFEWKVGLTDSSIYMGKIHEVSTEGSNIVEEGFPLDMSNHDEMVEVRNTIANDLWEKYTSRRANRGARV